MKPVLIRAFVILVIFFIGSFIAYKSIKKADKLPVFTSNDVSPLLIDSAVQLSSDAHTIAEFSLIDQDRKTITKKDFEGKIYVADFFFTTCPGICPILTGQMKAVYDEHINDNQIKFLSHTVMPEIDSVPVLKAYQKKIGVPSGKWHFVTGDKKHIYDLARKSYFIAKSKGDGGKNDFIHTENFALIDDKFQIRGYYDGTSTPDIERLLSDIQTLKEEISERSAN